jgi:outer membrane immunogenic protein
VAEQPAKGGFLGGGQVGVNWQFSPIWVGGLEADWDVTSAKYSFCRQNIGGGNACNELGVGEGFQTIDSKTPWLATFRGRFGVAWQNWLFYGTVGGAIGRVTTDLTMNCPFECGVNSETPIFASLTITTTKTGWVAGLGTELMLARNWAARAEWLYIDLGTVTDTLPTVGRPVVGMLGVQTASWSRTEVLRISARRELFVPLEQLLALTERRFGYPPAGKFGVERICRHCPFRDCRKYRKAGCA